MVDCHFIATNFNIVSVGGFIPIAGGLIGQCGEGVTIDRAASQNVWMRWIQGRSCPELALFGKEGSPGFKIVIK